MAAGMIKGLLALLTTFEVLDKASGTYLILNATGDGLFYFFPLFLGYTASKKFGGKPFIGMAIGAALVYPTIIAANGGSEAMYTLFAGSVLESPIYITFLGIPVILMSYTSSVIPIIAATYLASKLEAFFSLFIPRAVRSFFVSFLTLIITVPLVFLIVGPITTWAGLLLGQALSAAYEFSPIIAGIVIGGFWQVFIMFGLHWGFVPIALNNYATLGYDVVMMAGLATPVAMAGVYGVTLPRKKAFYTTSIAGAIAGGIMGLFKTRVYINGGTGIFALPRFIHPENGIDNSFIGFAIASAVAFALGFLITFFYAYDPKSDDEPASEGTQEKNVEPSTLNHELGQTILYDLATPVRGTIIPLKEVKDEAFSSGLLGKGLAVIPSEGKVYAPADGIVSTLFPTNHAVGITTADGVEVLIHVGMDTVNLKGQYFQPAVAQGDSVTKGQLLLSFDKDALEKEGYSIVTPIIISNTADYLDIVETDKQDVEKQDTLLTVIG